VNNFAYVPETRFGIWFLSTETWFSRVLDIALGDLLRLLGHAQPQGVEAVLDVGCGQGKSFGLLQKAFRPKRMIGLDADTELLGFANERVKSEGLDVTLMHGDGASIPLPDGSIDILFCHQTFHHLVRQERAIAEFYRVLKPGGMLLFAESTRAYIHSWIIRLLFRHPMHVQKSADEYLTLIRDAGFRVQPEHISYPYLWWSRSDLGLMERLKIRQAPPIGQREETLINLVATKPQ
jgi:ubiquinone/menaquinone biosynthesis C-methylase UbiE